MHVAKLFNLFKNITLNKSNFVHTYIYKMNKAYMRCPEGSEVFDFSFQYFNPNLNLNRQFNFSRKLEENVSSFITRVSVNVEKVINKKQKKKKTEEKAESNDNLMANVQLYQNGSEVPGETICKDLFTVGGDIRLKLLDHEYEVVINTPWVKNIALPTSILANFPVYPSKFETLFVDKDLSEFTWYKSADKACWTLVGTGFLYFPTSKDVGSFLKLCCVPKNSVESGPHTETEAVEKVQADPGPCPFEVRHNFTKEKLSGDNFRVVTYNLLADLYTDSEYSRTVLFPYCPPYALHIDYRKQLILKELMGFNADIICLQEVDKKVFDNDLNPVLLSSDLEGIFNRKGGTLCEGLACFYNKNRFKLLDTTSKILGEDLSKNLLFAELWSKISSNEKLIARMSDLGTTLQVTTLESLENNGILVVANVHLYFHPDADHIRLLQAEISKLYIESIMESLKKQHEDRRISLIFCGDFNSVPECGIYKLFTTGYVPSDFEDWNSNEEEAVKGVTLTNSRILDSACGTPKYTNFTVGFRDCLDYIFYEKDSLKVTQVIPLLSIEDLTAHTALPSVLVPSDHISLVADLEWL